MSILGLPSAFAPFPKTERGDESAAALAGLVEGAAIEAARVEARRSERHAVEDMAADRFSGADEKLSVGDASPPPVPDQASTAVAAPDNPFMMLLDEDPVRTTVKMRREGCGAISLNISNFRTGQSERPLRIGSFDFPPIVEGQSRHAGPAERSGRLAAGGEIAVEALGEFRREGEAMVFLFRFLEPPVEREAPGRERTNAGLPKWRLKRAEAYIEANLEETISLAALANAAGLSPTYFAAQFKASTGYRPHEYVMRRRIANAQRQLLDPRLTVIEIAISVGFQTQAHFTTAFKRIVGETPCRWRKNNYLDG